MPASYQFEVRETIHLDEPDTVDLGVADAAMCEWFGAKPDEKQFSLYYDMMIEWAFAALMNLGGTYIEQEHVDWIARKAVNKPDSAMKCDKYRHFVNWLFIDTYRFKAWR